MVMLMLQVSECRGLMCLFVNLLCFYSFVEVSVCAFFGFDVRLI